MRLGRAVTPLASAEGREPVRGHDRAGAAREGSNTEAASRIWEDRPGSCTGLRSPELRVDETWEGDKGRRKQARRSSAAHGCDLRSERERGSAGAGALARAGPPTWSCPGGESEVEVS